METHKPTLFAQTVRRDLVSLKLSAFSSALFVCAAATAGAAYEAVLQVEQSKVLFLEISCFSQKSPEAELLVFQTLNVQLCPE